MDSRNKALRSLLVAILMFLGVAGFVVLCVRWNQARHTAWRLDCMSNLHTIGIGLRNFQSEFGTLPPATFVGKDGSLRHSWRVLTLPYLEGHGAAMPYDFTQPWDSDTNTRVLAGVSGSLFVCPYYQSVSDSPHTRFVAVLGEGSPWVTSETAVREKRSVQSARPRLLVIELPDSGICWTEPRDIHVRDLLPTLRAFFDTPDLGRDHTLYCLTTDGEVRPLSCMDDVWRFVDSKTKSLLAKQE